MQELGLGFILVLLICAITYSCDRMNDLQYKVPECQKKCGIVLSVELEHQCLCKTSDGWAYPK